MPTVQQVLDSLEEIAPTRYAFSFDRVGLQVGDAQQPIRRAIVSLDRSLAAIDVAIANDAQLLVSHHPLIFRPIDHVTTSTHVGKTISKLITANIAFVAAHTNWDSAIGGINDALATLLGVTNVTCFGTAAETVRFKMVVYVPGSAANDVIDAASEAGAGIIGDYRRCAFTSDGVGTFHALETASPAVGQRSDTTTTSETRVEMLVAAEAVARVERAIRRVHPYESPAVDFVALRPALEQPAGRVGTVPTTTLREFVALVDDRLGTRSLAWGDPNRRISRVAMVGGAADDEWRAAQRAGADVLVTGEVKQHNALEAAESGFGIVSAGHYATEQPGCEALRSRLATAQPDIDWVLYTPARGQSGRPI